MVLTDPTNIVPVEVLERHGFEMVLLDPAETHIADREIVQPSSVKRRSSDRGEGSDESGQDRELRIGSQAKIHGLDRQHLCFVEVRREACDSAAVGVLGLGEPGVEEETGMSPKRRPSIIAPLRKRTGILPPSPDFASRDPPCLPD